MTCLAPFFCPFAYNEQWKEKINFIPHLTTYKFLHYKKSRLSTYIPYSLRHVMQAWRDVWVNSTPTYTSIYFSQVLRGETLCLWATSSAPKIISNFILLLVRSFASKTSKNYTRCCFLAFIGKLYNLVSINTPWLWP